jgi:hypothetical protein
VRPARLGDAGRCAENVSSFATILLSGGKTSQFIDKKYFAY